MAHDQDGEQSVVMLRPEVAQQASRLSIKSHGSRAAFDRQELGTAAGGTNVVGSVPPGRSRSRIEYTRKHTQAKTGEEATCG